MRQNNKIDPKHGHHRLHDEPEISHAELDITDETLDTSDPQAHSKSKQKVEHQAVHKDLKKRPRTKYRPPSQAEIDDQGSESRQKEIDALEDKMRDEFFIYTFLLYFSWAMIALGIIVLVTQYSGKLSIEISGAVCLLVLSVSFYAKSSFNIGLQWLTVVMFVVITLWSVALTIMAIYQAALPHSPKGQEYKIIVYWFTDVLFGTLSYYAGSYLKLMRKREDLITTSTVGNASVVGSLNQIV